MPLVVEWPKNELKSRFYPVGHPNEICVHFFIPTFLYQKDELKNVHRLPSNWYWTIMFLYWRNRQETGYNAIKSTFFTTVSPKRHLYPLFDTIFLWQNVDLTETHLLITIAEWITMFHEKIFRKDQEKVEKLYFNSSFPSSGRSDQSFLTLKSIQFCSAWKALSNGKTRKNVHSDFKDKIFGKDG